MLQDIYIGCLGVEGVEAGLELLLFLGQMLQVEMQLLDVGRDFLLDICTSIGRRVAVTDVLNALLEANRDEQANDCLSSRSLVATKYTCRLSVMPPRVTTLNTVQFFGMRWLRASINVRTRG